MLEYVAPREHWKAKHLDLNSLLMTPADKSVPRYKLKEQELNPHEEIDSTLIELSRPAIEKNEKVTIDMPVRNIYRTVGARLSGIDITFTGSVGQSFGAFLAPGINIKIKGDANDYLGKMMSGGRITVVPPENAGFEPHKNIIVGNVLLYGATGGEVYINGVAGERFMVRNSGAKAVVEGVGDHGCEYMTGGIAVILGRTGKNFAAGMSGGIAYVYDETELFDTQCNLDMVDLESVWHKEDIKVLRTMIEEHYKYTNSARARFILDNWQAQVPLFVKVMPIDYRKVMERMRLQEEADRETVAVTEEVYDG